jgi:heme/copper-type cytochrome/quinol oxidase subunit 2
MKVIIVIGLIIASVISASAQQQVTVCNPGQAPGSLVCQQQVGTAGRVAIVAAVVIAGTVVVLAVRYHKRHKDHPLTHTRGAERR